MGHTERRKWAGCWSLQRSFRKCFLPGGKEVRLGDPGSEVAQAGAWKVRNVRNNTDKEPSVRV